MYKNLKQKDVENTDGDILYLKLMNGDSIVGRLVEENEEGYVIVDVLQFLNVVGQFVPYDPFLGMVDFWVSYKDIMIDYNLNDVDENIPSLYDNMVESHKQSVMEALQQHEHTGDDSEASPIIKPDGKIIH